MDTVTVILEGLRVILGFLLLLFVPGFALSLVIFPRFNGIGIIERLAYSTVLSIGSVIVLVLFMDVFLGINTKPLNIFLVIAAFSCFAFVVWLCERWYLNSRFKKNLEPKISADYQKVQTFYTREIHAARDRFRQDTRTMVVYHESQQSGLNHIEHSYLLDVGEEIDIQQVAEDKVKVTDRVILPPPFLRTQFFELVIREYKEEGVSLVDDLQIYPVLVLKKPDKTLLRFVLQRGTTHISGRIYKKTSTTEVEWIYSHDFHLFAIIHTEDTLDQMVDRILGKLDEITISVQGGIHISSHAEDRQILKEAFDAVIIEKPHDAPVKPQEIAPQPEVQFSAELWEIPKRPVIIPSDVEPTEITKPLEVQAGVEPPVITKRPVILTGVEPKEILKQPDVLTGVEPTEITKRPVILTGVEPKEILKQPDVLTGVEPTEITKHPEVQAGVEPREITKRPVILTGAEPIEIPKSTEILISVEPNEFPKRSNVQPGDLPKEIPKRSNVQLDDLPKEILDRLEYKLGVEHIRKLQKEILRDRDMFNLTPDSFDKSKKNIENRKIPEKADVDKKLAELKEDNDVDWVDLE